MLGGALGQYSKKAHFRSFCKNVAWVFGQHDRGWQERAVFGKVRYMSAGGLERKAKPKQYVEKVGERIEDSE